MFYSNNIVNINVKSHDIIDSSRGGQEDRDRRMRRAGHVARMGEGRGVCFGKERDYWRDPGADGRIILTLQRGGI